MSPTETALLAGLFLLAALLYSSVGHAGASAYLAAMALFGVPPGVMRPTALVLNILVASLTTFRFHRAGCVPWRAVWPFVLGSIPAAYIGGGTHLPEHVYRPILGAILLFAAARLVWTARAAEREKARPPSLPLAVLAGAGIGLLSGLTGTGGGIFLTPLLLFTGWATTRHASGISAAFILANSVSGLAGNVVSVRSLPAALPLWLGAVLLGSIAGAELGSRRLPPRTLRLVLACVLTIAGLKLLFL